MGARRARQERGMSSTGTPRIVYLIAADAVRQPCRVCGGAHEFHSDHHVPLVVNAPEEWGNPHARFVPVEYQPGRHLLLSDFFARHGVVA
jgi:hypothetical protein